MKLWHFVVGALVLWLLFNEGGGTKRPAAAPGGSGYFQAPQAYPSVPSGGSEYFQAPHAYPSVPSGISLSTIDEVDCTVLNTTTGNGPYTLTCEMDDDEIRINFPNGGFIIVDSDGYHYRTGHYWDVELE